MNKGVDAWRYGDVERDYSFVIYAQIHDISLYKGLLMREKQNDSLASCSSRCSHSCMNRGNSNSNSNSSPSSSKNEDPIYIYKKNNKKDASFILYIYIHYFH